MDFETIMPAIPLNTMKTGPISRSRFSFRCMFRNFPGAPVSHFEFLGVPPEDPRPRFISELLWCISNKGSIVVYNQAFEQSRLREIARDLPAYAEQINQLSDRMVDLMGPFRSRQLYHPDMKGSYSIKKVLPALVPELSYDDLEISEGGTASLTYMSLYEDQDPESVQFKRDNLLEVLPAGYTGYGEVAGKNVNDRDLAEYFPKQYAEIPQQIRVLAITRATTTSDFTANNIT
jgi:hypothetical protein